jgi:hypothetical protein
MALNMLWLHNSLEHVAKMSRLRTGFLAARSPETASLRFLETIAGGWLTAVATMFRQLVFQDLDPCFQCTDDLRQSSKGRHDGVFALAVQSSNFIRSGQAH